MPRAASPAPSDGEIDIFDSLYTDDVNTKPQATDGDFDFLDDANQDDGDEAFIALKQAASYRKAANQTKGTGQKGGGFQSMGTRSLPADLDNIRAVLTRTRIERKTPLGYSPQRFQTGDPHSAKSDTSYITTKRCGGHG
jgi:ATP-dependent RNA helicase DDX54/DBP10